MYGKASHWFSTKPLTANVRQHNIFLLKKASIYIEAFSNFAVCTGLEPCSTNPVAVALLPNIFIYVDDL